MLGRRSTLIGAMVQATNTAIHNTIERKNPVANKAAHTGDQEVDENNNSKEVILATKASKTLQTSSPIK
jgi:hypothetical protein